MPNETRVREIADIVKWADDSRYSDEAIGIALRARIESFRAIAALPVQVSGEWKMVPVEPTEEMQRAGFLANVFTNPMPNCCDNPMRFARATIPADKPWRAMLAASPPAPASQVLTEEDQLIVQTAKRNVCGISTAPLDTRHLLVETVAIIDRLTNKDAEHG
jgi:hypothetical protein